MMSRARSISPEQVEQFWNIYADDVLDASDEDIIEATRRDGDDPALIAQRGRAVIEEAIRRHGTRLREQARQSYEVTRQDLERATPLLPRLYKDKIALVKACLTKHHLLRHAMATAHYRGFSHLTNKDLDSFLRQLHHLGLLEQKAKQD
ncbi:MAG: hypothetical protein Q8N00_02050 [Nitrospirota bacterium]|nr:hypothetical protein [Nitrospirota bacterium]MDP3595466.1 hypothetical protein [Nitrospirota bacterium]